MTSASQSGMQQSSLLLRSYRKHYPTAVRGEGVYLWDSEGRRYIDFASSAVVSFIGHGVPEIGEAIAKQAKQLEFVHSSQFVTEPAEQFARELLGFLGPAYRDGSVFFTSGGSEAVETALKLAAAVPSGERAGPTHAGLQPQAVVPRSDAGGDGDFGQYQAPGDLSSDAEGIRTRRHSVLLPM